MSNIRTTRALLFEPDLRTIVASVRIVTDDDAPALIMFEGEPFLKLPPLPLWKAGMLAYARTQPYRADSGLVETVAS